MTHIPLFKKHKTLTFKDIGFFSTALIMYKVYNNDVPYTIQNMVTLVQNKHRYNTRQKHNFYIKLTKSSLKNNTFKLQGPKIWNTIKENIQNSSNIQIFKYRLKKELLSHY